MASVAYSVSLLLGRDEAGEVVATAGVDTCAVLGAEVHEIRQPEHRSRGHEAFPVQCLFGLGCVGQPLGMRPMQAVSVFHDGDNLLVALGLEPGQPNVGDALLAQAFEKFLVHGSALSGALNA